MRGSARVLGASLLLTGLAAVFGAAVPSTHAASATLPAATTAPKVVQSNWYWYQQESNAPVSGIDLPEPSGVPAQRLAVANKGGRGAADPDAPTKETFLAFDLGGAKPSDTVTAFSFTMKLDLTAPQVRTTQPVLRACIPVRTWENGTGGEPATSAPHVDCSDAIGAADGKFDAVASAYTFTIPSIAQSWVSSLNTGVAIRHKETYTTPYQLVFLPAAAVTAKFAYTPGSSPVLPPGDQPTPVEQAPPTDTSGGSLSGGLGGAPSVGSGTTTAPAATAPTPQLAPRPVAAGEGVGAAGSVPALGFWLVGAVALGALVLISLVVGDVAGGAPPAGPASPGARGSRLDQVLRARRTVLTLETR